MSQDLKKLLGEVIEMHRAELCKMADLIYDFAEKSAEEYKSMELLTDYLQNEGFTVERGIALDTAFRATWDNCRAAVDDEGKIQHLCLEYSWSTMHLKILDMRADITCRDRQESELQLR